MKFSTSLKRITFCFFIICFSVIMYDIIEENSQVEQVNALPITNKIIIIDAGHGKPDEGATGFNATSEQAINLKLALKLQKLVDQSGAKSILTRSDENGIYSTDSKSIRSKKVSDTKKRVSIGNESDADIFVSIHLNKFPASSSYSGWQSFYQKNSEESRLLASFIQNNIDKNIASKSSREILPISNIYIMDHVKIPTVIIECGFLSNPEESELLKTDEYQNKLVWGIYLGIQEYFKERN